MMFWVMFRTTARRDGYRDVHNILALPAGSVVRFNYHERHLTSAAIAESKRRDVAHNVLVAYAQDKTYEKGNEAPSGPLSLEQGLWVGTRLATLRHLYQSENRYHFQLELLGYPAFDDAATNAIFADLSASGDVPFSKRVAISNLNVEFNSLKSGTMHDNWAAIVDRMSSPPSHFAGDSFWRVSRITTGPRRREIGPLSRRDIAVGSRRTSTADTEAIFPLAELDKFAIQIESRSFNQDEERDQFRTVMITTARDGPLRELNGRSFALARAGSDWIEADVGATERLGDRILNVDFKTCPASGDRPIGPEFCLPLYSTKHPLRRFLSLTSGVLGASCATIGILSERAVWSFILIIGGVLLIRSAQHLWSGRIRLSDKQLKISARSWIDIVSRRGLTIWRRCGIRRDL